MAERDPIEVMEDAWHESKDLIVDSVRRMKAEVVNRPALARKLTPTEYRERYAAFAADPQQIMDSYDELAQRYKLTEERPIPRRLVDYLLRGAREMQKAVGENQGEAA